MDDRPEHLVAVVGFERQPEQIPGIDLVAIRRCGLVGRRLEALRVPAVGSRPVADQQAAGLVGVLGAGVRDDLVARSGRSATACGPGCTAGALLTTS